MNPVAIRLLNQQLIAPQFGVLYHSSRRHDVIFVLLPPKGSVEAPNG